MDKENESAKQPETSKEDERIAAARATFREEAVALGKKLATLHKAIVDFPEELRDYALRFASKNYADAEAMGEKWVADYVDRAMAADLQRHRDLAIIQDAEGAKARLGITVEVKGVSAEATAAELGTKN